MLVKTRRKPAAKTTSRPQLKTTANDEPVLTFDHYATEKAIEKLADAIKPVIAKYVKAIEPLTAGCFPDMSHEPPGAGDDDGWQVLRDQVTQGGKCFAEMGASAEARLLKSRSQKADLSDRGKAMRDAADIWEFTINGDSSGADRAFASARKYNHEWIVDELNSFADSLNSLILRRVSPPFNHQLETIANALGLTIRAIAS